MSTSWNSSKPKPGSLIAVPSDDHVTIASHFGRARGFIVYRAGSEPEEIAYRPVETESKQHCGCDEHERPSRHQAILDALRGCAVVLARGMGVQMFDDLHGCGIEVVLTDCSLAERALEQFVDGSLPPRIAFECDREAGGYAPTGGGVRSGSRRT